MNLDWPTLDRWMIGEAWTGSRIDAHLTELCDQDDNSSSVAGDPVEPGPL